MALKPEIEIISKKKKRERERATRSKALSFLIVGKPLIQSRSNKGKKLINSNSGLERSGPN
jgi:hypothetical protein